MSGLTLDITGPPSGIASKHKNCAAAAPVHVVVRQPSKIAVASRLRKLRPDGIAAWPLARRLRAAFWRRVFRYQLLSPREGGCAAGRHVSTCASKNRQHALARLVCACASEVRLRKMPMLVIG
jgi:hypothetical protein